MKEIILFSSGAFAGMAMLMIWQIVAELRAFALEDDKPQIERFVELRDNEEVSASIRGDKYYE